MFALVFYLLVMGTAFLNTLVSLLLCIVYIIVYLLPRQFDKLWMIGTHKLSHHENNTEPGDEQVEGATTTNEGASQEERQTHEFARQKSLREVEKQRLALQEDRFTFEKTRLTYALETAKVLVDAFLPVEAGEAAKAEATRRLMAVLLQFGEDEKGALKVAELLRSDRLRLLPPFQRDEP